jgi:hypothetical protein
MKLNIIKVHRDNQNKVVEAVFGVFNGSRRLPSELIVVNTECEDKVLAFKKSLIGEHLDMIAHEGLEVTWDEIDTLIKDIMKTKIHFV